MGDMAEGWKKAVGYAFATSDKLWRERGNTGEPDRQFLLDWVPYYLAQQWDYKMPPGGLFS